MLSVDQERRLSSKKVFFLRRKTSFRYLHGPSNMRPQTRLSIARTWQVLTT